MSNLHDADNFNGVVYAEAQSSARIENSNSPSMFGQDPRFVQAEVIAGSIFTAIVLGSFLIGLVVLWLVVGLGIIFYASIGGWILLALLLSWLTFIWPKIESRHYHWRLDEQSLEIHRGVWWKHRIAIPLGRVQHADVAQGPLLRKFDLGELVIHTAGTGESKVELKGLSHATAMGLRDRLVAQAQSRVVT